MCQKSDRMLIYVRGPRVGAEPWQILANLHNAITKTSQLSLIGGAGGGDTTKS